MTLPVISKTCMNLEELQLKFSTEEACGDALYKAKWPGGFRCTRCGHIEAYKITTRRLPLLECKSCRYQESLTAGTVIEGSRCSLRKWFRAILLVSLRPNGINAVQLSRIIGVTYKTAWLILQKLRYAMSQADQGTMLSGIVRSILLYMAVLIIHPIYTIPKSNRCLLPHPSQLRVNLYI